MTATPSPRRRRIRWRRILTGLALLIGLGVVVGALIARQILVRPNLEGQAVEPIVVPVERGDLIDTVSVNGALEPRDEARVSFPEEARVREVLVERGDTVAAGAILARLETRDLELKVASVRAEVDQAQQALDKLAAGPSEADLAQAAARVARARADLVASGQEVRQIDIDVAKARLDTARQRLADLEAGTAPDDLSAAEKGLASAEEALEEARQNVEQTRDSASRAKTDAQQALEQGAQELERVQRAYSDAWWDWDYVQRTGRHPTETEVVDESGRTVHRELSQREVEAFRRALADAETSLRNGEQSVKNLSEAYDQARENEVRQIEAAGRGVATAERNLADARRTYETARTKGVQATILEARKDLAEAEKSYKDLVDNPARPARQAELEAALLEAVAEERKLRAGPDPVEQARARTALEQARAALATAEANLDAAALKAPIAGTVVDITLKPGTLTTTSDAVRIADLRGFLIRGQVTEQDVARVRAGQMAQVSIDSVPGESFPGELTLVGALPVSQGDQSQAQSDQFGFGPGSAPLGGLYPVEIAMQTDDERLRVGMATTASIEILAIKDVLLIPLQAVEYGEAGPFVRRAGGEEAPVELGASSGDQVQVLKGLSEGDQIIVPTIPPMEGGPPMGMLAP
ncbi:MAG: HlyD family efflux transporter periplasmic adaptor subunit [Chloroflexales bacterium]|nr:HlyD family efflux transporter periplasmic adaptor subunit [Chloroflexales bacterium]